MLYVDHIYNGQYAIADTDDNVIEYVSSLENLGIEVLSWAEVRGTITSSMVMSCNRRFYRAMLKEDTLYLNNHCVYALTDLLDRNVIDRSKRPRIFNYVENMDLIIVCVSLLDGSLVCIGVNADGECWAKSVKGYGFNMYPCCSGYNIMLMANRNGVDVTGINQNRIYLVLYGSDMMLLDVIDRFKELHYNIGKVLM